MEGTTANDDAAVSPASVLELAGKACRAYGREDLGSRVASVAARLSGPRLRVLVIGEFKKGKSSLVNGLVGASVCPVDDARATALPTVVRFAQNVESSVLHRDGEGRLHRHPLSAADRAARITTAPGDEPADADGDRDLAAAAGPAVAVEVGLPRKLLARGIELVDTPGVGGLDSRHAAATRAALADADAVVFVTDVTQELTAPELRVLREAADRIAHVVVVETKIGLVPDWRRIVELDRGHLAAAGLAEVSVHAVATRIREDALATGSQERNVESGYDVLVRWITERAAAHLGLASARVVRDLLAVADGLAASFESERAVLADPGRAERLIEELREAEERAQRLKAAGRWQQTLSDGVADLSSEVEFEFRNRMRAVTADAEELLGEEDPASSWGEFEPWLYGRVADDVVGVTNLLNERAAELASRVDDHFTEEGGAPGDSLTMAAPTATLARLDGTATAELRKVGVGQTGLTAVRGMQGGVMMFGMMGNLVGLTIAGPAMLGVGVVMGVKALRDERNRQRTVREQQARQALRKYLDEVSFHVGKENRDTTRLLQRRLRDHFSDRAAEAQRTVAEALAAAKRAVAAEAQDTPARLADISAELARIATLRARIGAAFGPDAVAGAAALDDGDDPSVAQATGPTDAGGTP